MNIKKLMFSLVFLISIGLFIFNFQVFSYFQPKATQELIDFVQKSKTCISIKGAGYSQGDQTKGKNCTQIDLKFLNKITFFDEAEKLITVQAGALWSDVQKYIDPYNLSVCVMQSYNDFSIGGSLSVNVHGRNVSHSQIIETIKSITILLADGSVKKANREENYELFRAAIGGYGLVGIILDVTLHLVENTPIKIDIQTMPLKDYKVFFEREIKDNPKVSLYNAKIYPHDFSRITNFTWYKTEKENATKIRLQKKKEWYLQDMIGAYIVRRIPLLNTFRPTIEARHYQQYPIVYRNYEMGHSVNELKFLVNFPTTTILQEYFIPVDNFEKFVLQLEKIKKKYKINMINISIRFVRGNSKSLLAYAPTDSFAFVLYIDILHPFFRSKKAKNWTQKLIDATLDCGGTYYLPYALFATKKQFYAAYPRVAEFITFKKSIDPANKFSNTLWQKYGR